MELTYTQCGDYLIPNLVLSDTKEYHIGKYGRMRSCLSEGPPFRPFTVPCCSRKNSFPIWRRPTPPAKNRLDIIESCHDAPGRRDRSTESRRSDGVGAPEEHSIHSRAEEIVLHELVYAE